jgi:hypothetical protein
LLTIGGDGLQMTYKDFLDLRIGEMMEAVEFVKEYRQAIEKKIKKK